MKMVKPFLFILLTVPLLSYSQRVNHEDDLNLESHNVSSLPFILSPDLQRYVLDGPNIQFNNSSIIEQSHEKTRLREITLSSSFSFSAGAGVKLTTQSSYKNKIAYNYFENESIAMYLPGGDEFTKELYLKEFDQNKLVNLAVKCQVKYSLTKTNATESSLIFNVNGSTPQVVPLKSIVSIETNSRSCRTTSLTSNITRVSRFGINVEKLRKDRVIPKDFIAKLCNDFKKKSLKAVKNNFDIIVKQSIYESSENYCRSDSDCPMPDRASIMLYGLNRKTGQTLNKRQCYIKPGSDLGLCRIVAKRDTVGACTVFRKGSDNKLYNTSGSFTRPCENGYVCHPLNSPERGYSILSLLYHGVDNGKCVKKPEHCDTP